MLGIVEKKMGSTILGYIEFRVKRIWGLGLRVWASGAYALGGGYAVRVSRIGI